MAIQLPQGFIITGREPIDNRLVLTKAEMYAVKIANMPDNYICLCKDDQKLYIFNSANEKIEGIGRFRLYEAPVDQADMALKLPSALSSAMADPTKAQEIINAMFDTEQFEKNIDNKVSLAIGTIQAITGNEPPEL